MPPASAGVLAQRAPAEHAAEVLELVANHQPVSADLVLAQSRPDGQVRAMSRSELVIWVIMIFVIAAIELGIGRRR